MTGRTTPATPAQQSQTTVACPHCERSVTVTVPDQDSEPTASPYRAAVGDYTTTHCPVGHEFWVYYC